MDEDNENDNEKAVTEEKAVEKKDKEEEQILKMKLYFFLEIYTIG